MKDGRIQPVSLHNRYRVTVSGRIASGRKEPDSPPRFIIGKWWKYSRKKIQSAASASRRVAGHCRSRLFAVDLLPSPAFPTRRTPRPRCPPYDALQPGGAILSVDRCPGLVVLALGRQRRGVLPDRRRSSTLQTVQSRHPRNRKPRSVARTRHGSLES